MFDLSQLIQSQSINPWIYLPVAVLLGALHALEPGHAKSVIAAYIVAIQGSGRQAALLGLSAAVGHTIVIWVLALGGLYFGAELLTHHAEGWLLLISGAIILALAWRVWRSLRRGSFFPFVHARGAPTHSHDCAHGEADHDGHGHDHSVPERNDCAHGHDHSHGFFGHKHLSQAEIEKKYGSRAISDWDIIWFGFSGGLAPCPSALAVLLVCLNLQAVTLGVVMVGAFSVGLALTLISIGLFAAWGLRRAQKSWRRYDSFSPYLPYASAGVVALLGLYMLLRGGAMIWAANF